MAHLPGNPIEGPLVWIDLEMTGLNTTKDHIIEIATIITDAHLHIIAEMPSLIIHQPRAVMSAMDDWCTTHHRDSGLTSAVLASTLSITDAERQTLAFIKKWIPTKGEGVLAGNSVHVDRMFLCKECPQLVEWLHYRIVDVSTVKELVRRWMPGVADGVPPKGLKHRALDDIRESIEELWYYRKAAFRSP
ncbi:mitochondrial oligoribonuclease [Fimicolochytrium jonesii]|uniref:mitochondrial oligoribonuclease n=1 Tax=Fimicolochytrium jonesii TaxID=1396493 RepID=UPI0022FEA7D1|nr:mitochondrial oligoribonuclease [Fimicolochytrium jonesii]KAI8822926.1 mitochondrial oligoribonuclease [Fimicolochytrium jonesii]